MGFNVLRKSQVVHNGFNFAANIPVPVDASYQLLSNRELAFIQSEVAELGEERLMNRRRGGNWNFHIVVIVGMCFETVVVVVADIVGQVEVIVFFLLFFLRRFILGLLLGAFLRVFFQGWINFQFFFNAIGQLYRGHLQQFNELYLLRRQFLLQRLI